MRCAAAAVGAAVVAAGALAGVLGAQETAPDERPAYASSQLRLLVARAAVRTRGPAAYVARHEAERAAFRIREDGRVVPQVIHQRQSRLAFDAAQVVERLAAERTETYELDPAIEKALRLGWLLPDATGDRIRLRQPAAAPPTRLERLLQGTAGRFGLEPDTLPIVHPLASDRERAYRFTAVDTLALQLDDGTQTTGIRLRVEPRARPPAGVLVFTGDVWLDARTLQLRRMIGRVDRVRRVTGRARAAIAGDVAPVAYLDVQTVVRDGAVVPGIVLLEESRRAFTSEGIGVLRVQGLVDYDTVRPTMPPAPPGGAGGAFSSTTDGAPAPWSWRLGLGEATDAASGVERRFAPWWPERERPTGPAIGRLEVRRDTDLYRYNKVEGLFTGVGVSVRLRDVMPGGVLRLTGGRAWHEGAWRGRASLNRVARGHTIILGAGRFLDLTNDFRSPYDSGSTVNAALFSQDPYDYVDRRYARLGVERRLPEHDAVLRLEAGLVRDGAVTNHVTRGWSGSRFLANRAVDAGAYGRVIALLDWQRSADLDPTSRRIGGTLRAEVADGQLTYQRLDARVTSRWRSGPAVVGVVGNAGAVFGAPPPQQLFELGAQQHLPGYAYKEFAGDRAATLDLTATLSTGLLRFPVGEIAGFAVPAPAPAVVFGVAGGWSALTSAAAQAAAVRLGPVFEPGTGNVLPAPDGSGPRVPRGTGTVRRTASVGLQLFGGALYVGVGRAIDGLADAPTGWRTVVSFGR